MTSLIHDIDVVGVRGDLAVTEVRGVEFDSRRVGEGSLFCCVPGLRSDGHRFAADAVSQGASCLLCERILDLDVTQVQVAPGSVRPAMALLSSTFFGHPARSMTMVGVTGTNGKTTVTHLVASILERAGYPTGIIGTLGGERTTPESPVTQGLLAGFRDEGRRAVAMEVSSHGLAQNRVDGIVFDVAAFTNLSRDHLDHHGTMEEYFATKARLFEKGRTRTAVIDVDDPWGRQMAERASADRVVTVQRSDATDISLSIGWSSFRWRGRSVTVPLSGMFNVDNALVAAAVGHALGIDVDLVAEGLAAAAPVPGRMEVVWPGPPFAVVVDYAHTPAGLTVALAAARHLASSGRVVSVFGAGGDRDQGKRPAMGEAGARGSELVVLTSDNPRSEDPAAIIDQIRSGIGTTAQVVVEPDRAEAIATAIGRASVGDVVVIAGKGHEVGQYLSDRVVPFDDRVQARRALADRGIGTDSTDSTGGGDR
jgi:UDP-N-acetylmuramoyl-L-alanyl-D-glutamate--2,6-diaminopimelate ligase